MASFFREKFCDNVFCSGQVVSIFEHTVTELHSLLSFTEMYCFQIILGSEKKIPLLKGTVLQIIGKSPFLFHSPSPSILLATFLSGRHDTADWRRLKDFKEGTNSVRRVNKIAIFGIFFGVDYYWQGCKILPEIVKKSDSIFDLSLYKWTWVTFVHFLQYFASLSV